MNVNEVEGLSMVATLADELENLAEQLNNPGFAICRKSAIRLRKYEDALRLISGGDYHGGPRSRRKGWAGRMAERTLGDVEARASQSPEPEEKMQ